MALNDTLDWMHLTDIFRTFHPKAAEYTFFSSAHGTFSRIDHMLGHKSAPSKYKKIEIILCIFSDHNAMKLEINHKKKFEKVTNTWRLKSIISKNEWTNKEIKEPKTSGTQERQYKRKVYTNPGLLKEERNISDTKLTLHLKELEKEQQIKPQTSRRQEIIKIRAEINAIETKKTVEQINETRSWFFERISKTDKPPASLIKRKRKGPK